MASTDDEAELLVLGHIDRSLNSEVGVRLLEGNVLAQARLDALKVRTAVGRTLGERPRHNHLGDRRWPAHKFFRKALIAYQRPTAFPPLHLGNFGATLRDHQEDGVKEMVFLESTMGGGLLADDMGLGKTIQVLALIAQDRKPPGIERTPTLIVVEKSLMLQWQREIENVMPRNDFKYAVHGNLKSKDGFPHSTDMSYDHFRQLDIVLVTYETVEYEHDKVRQWQEGEEASDRTGYGETRILHLRT
jgi:SNF2 family DNA or RNA helicase